MISHRCWLGIALLLTTNIGTVIGLYTPKHATAETSKSVVRARFPADDIVLAPNEVAILLNDDRLPTTTVVSNEDQTVGQLAERDVYSPKILSPDASTVWKRGSMVKVTW